MENPAFWASIQHFLYELGFTAHWRTPGTLQSMFVIAVAKREMPRPWFDI